MMPAMESKKPITYMFGSAKTPRNKSAMSGHLRGNDRSASELSLLKIQGKISLTSVNIKASISLQQSHVLELQIDLLQSNQR
jgi:hypothetical protein